MDNEQQLRIAYVFGEIVLSDDDAEHVFATWNAHASESLAARMVKTRDALRARFDAAQSDALALWMYNEQRRQIER
jgi:hypothetical protein